MMDWPVDTPPEVARLADELAVVLDGEPGHRAVQTAALILACIVYQVSGIDDIRMLRQIRHEVDEVALRYGAMRPRAAHLS